MKKKKKKLKKKEEKAKKKKQKLKKKKQKLKKKKQEAISKKEEKLKKKKEKAKKKKPKKKKKKLKKKKPVKKALEYCVYGKFAKCFHLTSCWVVGDISKHQNVKLFYTTSEATEAGYRQCSHCKPAENA